MFSDLEQFRNKSEHLMQAKQQMTGLYQLHGLSIHTNSETETRIQAPY